MAGHSQRHSPQVTVSGKAVSLLLYFGESNSGTAAFEYGGGRRTITATFIGRASSPAPITVTPNNFGVYTVPQNGSGRWAATGRHAESAGTGVGVEPRRM
ncbi:hypothetical protein SBA3_3190009 [Candidatus Sulfopaludibacter sp. SbA3]|nr:hypothetical protein SBA3_3190009 [Candidatus Sulfopaludibacter sp. SbA3]